jgi:uncharacterized membrane protein YbhN (UPF0104 family)
MKERFLSGASGRLTSVIRLGGTLVAVGLLVYLLSQQGWQEIGAAIRQISWWRFLLSLVLIMISRLAVANRWHILLRSAGLPITPAQSLRITFAGLFATNFLPTTVGGDLVRLAGGLQLKLDAAICAASLIADRLVGMAGMLMVIPFGLPRFLEARQLAVSLLPAEQAFALGLAASPLAKWWKKIRQKGSSLAFRLLSALRLWLKQPGALLVSLFFTWVHMLCLFTIFTLLFDGLGEHLPFWLTGGLYSIVYLITLLPFSINGYGIQEVSMTLIFSSAGGASLASSLTVALLYRTLTMIGSMPGVAFVSELLPAARQQATSGEVNAEK